MTWAATGRPLTPSDPGVRVCQVGQREPCGAVATRVIAIMTVFDNVWTLEERRGGVTFLCDFHGTTAPDEWDEATR